MGQPEGAVDQLAQVGAVDDPVDKPHPLGRVARPVHRRPPFERQHDKDRGDRAAAPAGRPKWSRAHAAQPMTITKSVSRHAHSRCDRSRSTRCGVPDRLLSECRTRRTAWPARMFVRQSSHRRRCISAGPDSVSLVVWGLDLLVLGIASTSLMTLFGRQAHGLRQAGVTRTPLRRGFPGPRPASSTAWHSEVPACSWRPSGPTRGLVKWRRRAWRLRKGTL